MTATSLSRQGLDHVIHDTGGHVGIDPLFAHAREWQDGNGRQLRDLPRLRCDVGGPERKSPERALIVLEA